MRQIDEGDIWIEDYPEKQKDLEDLEILKSTGFPVYPEFLGRWMYTPNVQGAWMDEDGNTITNPKRYKLSPKGMPILKEEFDMAKKSVAKDKAMDKKKGIKEGSPEDEAIDKGGFVPFTKKKPAAKKKK